MSLADILAAKKAALAAAVPASTPAPAPVVPDVPAERAVPEPVKEEPAIVAAPKQLSFAEKLALKRAAVPTASAVIPAAAAIAQNTEAISPIASLAETPEAAAPAVKVDEASILRTGAIALDVPPEVAQAASDIKERIASLSAKVDSDLKNAMSELKKALMANPAAVSLMEDTDIGQMVIALRKITGETITEVQKDGTKKTKKIKEVDLSDAGVVASVLEEL